MRNRLATVAALMLIAACTSPPPPDVATDTSDNPDRAAERVGAVMMLDDVTNELATPFPTAPTTTATGTTVTATATTVVELSDETNGAEDTSPVVILEDVTNEPAAPHVDPDALGKSYRDQAETAVATGDLAAAGQHYMAWLRADPTDANSWYNLACVQSLRGEHEAALLSFRASLNAGFDQLEHATRDSDLDAIRDDPRFGQALEAAVARAAESELDGMERQVVLTETIGTYMVLLPLDYASDPDRAYPLCVLLHGSGSDEVSHGRVAKPMGREGVIYIAPRALQAHVGATIARQKAGWSVWPPNDTGEETGIDPMSVHVEWIFRCIDDAMARYRIQNDRVAIWGHSQGAASAVSCAALHPERVTTICAYAGYYPEPQVTDARVAAMVAEGVNVRLGHARNDGVVDPKGTEEFEKRLREARAEFEVRWFTDGGHALSPEVIEWSKLWLRGFVDGAR